jgi:hypothetical protein
MSTGREDHDLLTILSAAKQLDDRNQNAWVSMNNYPYASMNDSSKRKTDREPDRSNAFLTCAGTGTDAVAAQSGPRNEHLPLQGGQAFGQMRVQSTMIRNCLWFEFHNISSGCISSTWNTAGVIFLFVSSACVEIFLARRGSDHLRKSSKPNYSLREIQAKKCQDVSSYGLKPARGEAQTASDAKEQSYLSSLEQLQT